MQELFVGRLIGYASAMEDKPKRPRGRPTLPPGEALDAKLDMRVTTALKEKVERLGHAWARKALEKAKPPKDAE